MLDWIVPHIGTIAVGALLLAVFGAIVFKMIKNKKEGKTTCGCGCSGCAMREQCHPTNKET